MEEDLRMAEELSGVEDMTATEASFVERSIKKLRESVALSSKDLAKLKALHGKYVPAKEETSDDDIDEDDFV